MDWNETFLALFDRCISDYKNGGRDYENWYSKKELGFLDSIGCQKREFFDFVEDFCEDGVPSVSTALLVAAVRRDWFLTVQNRQPSDAKPLTADDIPTFGEELEGIAYLPRIIAKGRAKLRGQLDPDLMFDCGGDRNFLSKHGGIHPADFLRNLWAADGDDGKVAAWVRDFETGK